MFALFMLGGDFKIRFAKLFLHPGTRILVVGVVAFVSLAAILPRMTKATLDTPQILSYQGRLTDAQKVTIADGSQSMKFAVYDASVAGTCLWSAGDDIGDGVDTTFSAGSDCPANVPSTAVSVSVTDGLFQVLLGASPQNAFPDSLFNTTAGQERWLEIRIGAETLSPRRRLGSSPSALQAGNASLLDNMDTSQIGGSVAFVPVTDSSGNLVLTKNLTIDTNTLFVNAVTDQVGIGTTSMVASGANLEVHATSAPILAVRNDTTFQATMRIGDSYFGGSNNAAQFGSVNTSPVEIVGGLGKAIIAAPQDADYLVFNTLSSLGTVANERIRINSAGNVGIGTSSPGTILDVRGNITVLSGSDFRPTADAVNALNIANAAGTDFVSFDTTNGRVGIGSAAPGARLDIAAAENTERLRLTDTTNVDSIGQYVGVGTPESFVTAQLGSIYFDSGGAAYLKTSGDNTNTGWQQITAGGSGANTSLSNLTTTSINQNLLPDSDDVRDLGSPSLRWQNLYLGPTTLHIVSTAAETTTARDWKLSVQETNGATEGNLRLMEGASEFVSVTPAGDVGIGSTAPGAKLDVQAGTMTTDVYPLLIGGTWNNSGVAFTGLKVNMTDTASDATSKLLDLQVGGSSKFSVMKDGTFSATGKFTVGTTAGPGDPAGVNGDVVYNIALGKLRCYENGAWTNCVTAAGSAGGWTDFGSYLNLTTISDKVGIGLAGIPTYNLEVAGTFFAYGGSVGLNSQGSGGVTMLGTGPSAGALTAGSGSNTFAIDTSSWDISSAGVASGLTGLASSGTVSFSSGASVSGGTVSINASGSGTTLLGTSSSAGAVTIGGNFNTVAIDSSSWDISSAGVASGLTGLTSSGTVAFTAGATVTGGTTNINASGSGATNIGTGASAGAVIIGSGSNTLTVNSSITPSPTNTLNLGSDANNFSSLFIGANGIVFEGSTNNAFETTVGVADPTGDNSITFPNTSGTVLLDSTLTTAFTIAGTSGSSQAVGIGQTVTIASGSANITTTAGSPRTVTVDIVSNPNFTSLTVPTITSGSALSLTSATGTAATFDSGTSGTVSVGATNATALTIGRSTVTTTVNGTFVANTLQSSSVAITGGTLNGTSVGATTPSTGAFTTLSATGNTTLGDATTDATTVNGTLTVGSISGSGVDPTGAAGMVYYNSSDNKFRCFENGSWANCINASAGNGWTDDGTIVRLTTGTDQVRIGTSAVGNGQTLEVNGVIRSITGGFQFPDGTTQTTAAATSSGVSSTGDVNISSNTDNSAGGDTIISTSTSERMRITSAGNVGIGTSGPGARLEVNGTVTFSGNAARNISVGNLSGDGTADQAINIATSGYDGTLTMGNGSAVMGLSATQWSISTAGTMVMNGSSTLGDSAGDATLVNGSFTTNGNAVTNIRTANLSGDGTADAAINIGTAGYDGTITIGNGSSVMSLTATNWSMTTAGTLASNGSSTLGNDAGDATTINGSFTTNGNAVTNIRTANLSGDGTADAAINIGTSGYDGTITIGSATSSSVMALTATQWSISSGGAIVMNGNATLGNAAADVLTMTGQFNVAGDATTNIRVGNQSGNGTADSAINIGTGGYDGAITLTTVSPGTLALSSPTWGVTTGGALTTTGSNTLGDAGGDVNTLNGALMVATNAATNIRVGNLSGDGTADAAITIGTTGYDGVIAIGTTSPGTLSMSSPTWNISTAGAATGFTTFSNTGTTTHTGALTVTGNGAVNLLAANQTVDATLDSAINIGTTGYDGNISLGTATSGRIAITSPTWNITAAGVASGFTGYSGSGTTTLSGALTVTANGAVNILAANQTGNGTADSPINIGTGGYDGAITLTTVSPGTLALSSPTWGVTTGGALTTIGSNTLGDAAGDTNTLNGVFTVATNATTNIRVGNLSGDGTADAAITIGTTGYDGAISIGTASPGTLALSSPTWAISTAGVATGFAAFTNTGLTTHNGGLTVTANGAVNLLAANQTTDATLDSAINIGTTGYDGNISLGTATSGRIAIASPTWNITTAGAASGFTTFSNSGATTHSGALTVNTNGAVNILAANQTGDGTADSAINIGTSSYDGTITIGSATSSSNVAITSTGWSMSAAGALSAIGSATLGDAAGDTITLNGALTVNTNAATNIRTSNLTGDGTADAAINIATGGYDGTMTVGSGSANVVLSSVNWGITSGGVVSSTIPASAFTERLCWDASGISTIADCTGTPGDYAEMYGTSDRHVEAGDIVMLDASRNAVPVIDEHGVSTSKAYVLKSDRANSPLVFGIVATAPNETIGQAIPADELPRPIALSGRVPVKVNEENGRINIGDPITSSSVPGVGMKATANGMIVGFALSASTGEPNETIIVSVHTGWWNGAALVANNAASGISAPTVSTFTITHDTDYALYSIYNIRSIRGMNWSISEQGDAVLHTVATQQLTITKTSDMATIGEGVMKLGEQRLTITNAAMEPTSKVFLSWRGNPGSFAMITNRAAGSFTIGLVEPAIADAEFDYWIVAVEDQRNLSPGDSPLGTGSVESAEPAETTVLTEPATTTTLTEPATTTTLTEPAAIIEPTTVIPTPDTSTVDAPVPEVPIVEVPTPVESVPVEPASVSEPVPETTVVP